MAFFLKRRRADSGVSFGRPFKMRRTRFRRRRFGRRRGMRQGYAHTTEWGRPYSMNYRKRKTRPRKWRNILIRDTEAKPHYRSLFQGVKTVTASAVGTPGVAGVWLFPALQVSSALQPFHTAAENFWQPGGGGTDIDFGVTIPTFRGDVVLRGGIARCALVNNDNLAARVKIYAIWAQEKPEILIYTSMNNTNRPVEFDPSVFPDFTTEFGRILYHKQATIRQGEAFEMVHRFKPQKIDQNRFQGDVNNAAGSQLWWLVTYAPLEPNALAENLRIINSWNLSFSADAI